MRGLLRPAELYGTAGTGSSAPDALATGGTTGQIPIKASNANDDWGYGNPATLSNNTPLADSGAGSAGTGTGAARDDHVHPASAADKLGLTPTAVKTSAYTAAVGDFVPVDTTSGSVTITLPTAPADGSVIAIKHVIRASTNTVTIARGGADVFNKAAGSTSLTLFDANTSMLLQYKTTGAIWYVVADDLPRVTATRGDLIVRNATNEVALPVGTAGQVLQSNGTDPAWGAVSAVALTEAPAVDQTYTGVTVTMTYGESLVPGDVVYFKSDGKVWKADSDGVATYPAMGLAMETASSGSHVVLLHGIYRDDVRYNWTVGGVIYLSTTAGTATQTQPAATDNVIQVLGIATHADRFYFKPDLSYITHI
jgi:hypothetical protein